jgi:hypothetical protein
MTPLAAARRFAAWVSGVASLVVLFPVVAAAQEPVRSFDQLNTRLRIGDTVRVTDAQGREIQGKLRDLHDASISVEHDGLATLRAEDVRAVSRVRGSKLLGCLIGFGAGVAGGFAVSAAAATGEEAMGGYVVPFLGAGIGTLVGAFTHRVHDVYRAPGPSGSARLSIAPVITSRARGVTLTVAF